jgi:DNA-binding MarR family transcriptional regulator
VTHQGPARPGYEIGMAVRTLLRAGRRMQSVMGQRLSLGETDLNAMDELVRSDQPMGPVELGNRLGIRSASATMLVDRLESAGHLRRERHPTDRRRITLYTTESARREVLTTLAPLLVSIDAIASALDEDESRVVLGFLRDVTEAINAFSSESVESGD